MVTPTLKIAHSDDLSSMVELPINYRLKFHIEFEEETSSEYNKDTYGIVGLWIKLHKRCRNKPRIEFYIPIDGDARKCELMVWDMEAYAHPTVLRCQKAIRKTINDYRKANPDSVLIIQDFIETWKETIENRLDKAIKEGYHDPYPYGYYDSPSEAFY